MRLNARGELCFPDAAGRLRRCRPDGTAITGRESADRVEAGDSAVDWYNLTPKQRKEKLAKIRAAKAVAPCPLGWTGFCNNESLDELLTETLCDLDALYQETEDCGKDPAVPAGCYGEHEFGIPPWE